MATKLAIIAPQIGAISETFIQRHMEDILQGETVVIAGNNQKPYAGHWDVDCPTLILNQIFYSGFLQRCLNKIAYQFNYKLSGEALEQIRIKKVERFLKNYNIKAILSEYLDLSLPWIPIAKKLNIPFYAHAHGYDISCRLKEPEWCRQYLLLNQATGNYYH
jgi:colanic acid/amylovoran biosynthesis glycosyltransferase